MTLETMVLQQDQFGGGSTAGPWIQGFINTFEVDSPCNSEILNAAFGSTLNSNNWNLSAPNVKARETNYSSQENFPIEGYLEAVPAPTTTTQRKRRRSTSVKNQEEVEHQRMTHITIERNRRKQMNNYLSVIRSMMPPSYVQRGDQASIVGGAINYVKELEQLLQSLEANKRIKKESTHKDSSSSSSSSSLFSYFFTFPQYSTSRDDDNDNDQSTAKKRLASKADVEVTMVESHANLKILIRRQPKQLLKMVDGLYSLCLSILHINVTTAVDHMVLYSFSVKAEEECQLSSVNEIAAAVNAMVGRIQDETVSNISCECDC